MLEFLESVIRDYGYLALFVGTFLEGETILLVAGFLAYSGQLDLTLCIITAFFGSLSGDQAAFYVGRWKGRQFIESRPKWKCRVQKVHQMLERFHEVLILSFRFFYGLRNLTPFVLGTTDIPGLKFFLLNSVGAAVWALTFGFAGYFFGTMVATVLKDIHHIELIIIFVALGLATVVWYFRHRKRKKDDQACVMESDREDSAGAAGDDTDSARPKDQDGQ